MSEPTELEELLRRQLEITTLHVAVLGILVRALDKIRDTAHQPEIREIAVKALADMADNPLPGSTKKALEELAKTIPIPSMPDHQ